MAAALVGGSVLSAFLQVLFDRIAPREFSDFFRVRKLNDRLLKKLKLTLMSIKKVLNDAVEKQIGDTDVKDWLDELKDALYEADDFLDEISYEVLRSKLEAGTETSSNQVRSFSSSLNPLNDAGVEAKLEEILKNLEDLVQQKDVLGLKEGIGEKPSFYQIPTTSLVDESGIYGRHDDKESIMKLLLSKDANDTRLDVIPIVGMGGIGKTTLAQLVYNDSRVEESFDLKVWVYISQEFDVLKATRDILKNIGSMDCHSMTKDKLHRELEKKLSGKRVLLVLDDVWSENQRQWDFLLTPFKSVAQGSKIIVTTRSDRVGIVRPTVPPHHLQKLGEDDCWLLFSKRAFNGESFRADRELEEIGREIAKKCQGLPLAAKTLGGLLGSKKDAYEWEKILKSNIWDLPNDEILPVLRLSYQYLPSHLKQCFAYCALFPKGYEFQKEKLVLLWMAEGFIVEAKGNKKLEEIGDEYFNDLVTRSFFQQSPDFRSRFVMHDFINDLAKFVAGEFCVRLEDYHSCKPSKKTRHSSSQYHASEHNFESLKEAEFLLTFLAVNPSPWLRSESTGDTKMIEFVMQLRRLRVLSPPQYIIGNYLCKSIGDLKHLRYLDLHGTGIRLLPESLTTLYNLQTLILYDCKFLDKLPDNMLKLINLLYLDIRGRGLVLMPPQMGKLMKLQTLTDFVLAKQGGSSITELGKLQHLEGNLCIKNLQNVVSVADASKANLKEKHLEELTLKWKGDSNDSVYERQILEKLQPHANVKHLSIYGYGGTSFPDWVCSFSLSNIVSLVLGECMYASSLPPLGQLASLKYLVIKSF